jgi:uncharacterized protein
MQGFSYTAQMKPENDPRRLHLSSFAQAGGQLLGEERLAHFERLIAETQGVGPEARVHFSAHGEMRLGGDGVQQVWLRLSAQAALALTCQRCLGPAEVTVEFAREFRFVATEELAAVEDEVCEEDVLVISRAFNLLELIEDELLMALPIAPMHDTCPVPVQLQAADVDFDQGEDESPNPFAVLQQLKRNGPH